MPAGLKAELDLYARATVYRLIGIPNMQRVKALQRGISWLAHRSVTNRQCVRKQPLVFQTFSVRSASFSQAVMAYKMVERGRLNTMDYRVFISE